MQKKKALSKLKELIGVGEDLIANKEYYDLNKNCGRTGVLVLSSTAKGYKVDEKKLVDWKQEIKMFLSYDKFRTSLEEFNKEQKHKTSEQITEYYLAILKSLYKSIDEDYIELEQNSSQISETNTNTQNAIFVGHGHSPLWAQVTQFLQNNLGCENVIYFEKESRTGKHIGDILKGFANEAKFAIVLMTAEDETKEDKIRARQNVIHEIGFFQGKLGFEKVAILKEDKVEKFSNIDGFQYIEFSGNNIKQTFFELQEMLKRENII